jgi:hypothetical protein
MMEKRQVKISYLSFIISESLLHPDICKSDFEPANQARREGGKTFETPRQFADSLTIIEAVENNGRIPSEFEIDKPFTGKREEIGRWKRTSESPRK